MAGFNRRKKGDVQGRNVYVFLNEDLVEELDRIAAKANISRSQLVSNMVRSGIDDWRMLEKIGLVPVVLYAEKVQQWLRRTPREVILQPV